jgi:TRAP-type C4-dicarboxylate transport system substrate-binding protein
MSVGRARWGMLVAVAFVAAATGCGGSGDKAGGEAERDATLLTLATHDRLYAHDSFAAAVRRLSGGSLRIAVRDDWRDFEADYELGIVRDVRAGRVKLGIVGVRVWDTMGVAAFRALVAPLLVDSYDLERRILQSPKAARALEGVDEAGVVGIALLPGTLRRPLGFTRPLVGPQDYRGVTFGIRPAQLAAATLHALGAKAKVYAAGQVWGLDGAELDLTTLADNGYDLRARALTANVVLWPRIQTIVMNRAAFESLTTEQQETLLRAGRDAVVPELARLERAEQQALALVCEHRSMALVNASSAQRTALEAAVRPVYELLGRDRETREWIGEIARARAKTAGQASGVRCAGGGAPASPAPRISGLDGRWKVVWTREELIAAGIEPETAATLAAGSRVLISEFRRGRFKGRAGARVVSSGTYTVAGDLVRLVFDSPAPPGTVAGKAYDLRWSRYRDVLSFSAVPGREPLDAMLVKPLTRVR